MLCFVLINSVLLNLSCVWILGPCLVCVDWSVVGSQRRDGGDWRKYDERYLSNRMVRSVSVVLIAKEKELGLGFKTER